MILIPLIILILLLAGVLSRWGRNRDWGYNPKGSVCLVLLILVAMVALGYLPRRF